jgi:DNA polymerase elongation subunit (family B)
MADLARKAISPPPSPPPVQLVCAEMTGPHTMALIGRDANGDSVAVLVDNVSAYLWVRVPDSWLCDDDGTLNKTIWESFLSNLNDEASDKIKSKNAAAAASSRTNGGIGSRFCVPPWILKKMGTNGRDRTINVIKTSRSGASEARRFSRFHGYDAARHLFGRVALTAPDAMRVVVGLLEHPTAWMRRRLSHRTQNTFELAEATLAVTTQACADMGLTPGGWFSLRAGITPAPQGEVRVHHTYTNVDAADVVPLPDRTGLAPLKVLSFDIEVYTKDLGHGAVRFFDGDDPAGKCLCIAACTLVVGRPEVQRVVFAIDPDSAEPRDETVPAVSGDGAVVLIRWLPDETQLLIEFSEHLRDSDADFVTGWNTDRFDFGWLALAAKRLGIDKEFWDFSRFKFQKSFYNTKFYGKKADAEASKRKVILKLPGRVPYDLMTWFKKNYQLPDYKLASVAELYGCGAKDDVAYLEIGNLFKTPAGRLKLALYCEQDTALVLKLVANTKLDPVGKDMALCSITGVWPTDLLGRGTQNTLRCKMLRVAHARGFVLPHVPGLNRDDDDDAPAGVEADGEEEEDNGYQGGKVLTAQSGRYTDPVVVSDFGSLYPSCMEQHNICKSSQLTRARAQELGVPFTVPPAPCLSGTWRTPSGDVVVTDNFRTGIIAVDGDASFRYETDINEAIVGAGGKRAVLEDSGYALRWHTGDVWTRHDEDVLCFTTRDHFTGIVPQLEADLKIDRKAAKKKMAQAEAAGDYALQQFCNNLQNSIKVLMNGLYG